MALLMKQRLAKGKSSQEGGEKKKLKSLTVIKNPVYNLRLS
jgi:hypothetical protein